MMKKKQNPSKRQLLPDYKETARLISFVWTHLFLETGSVSWKVVKKHRREKERRSSGMRSFVPMSPTETTGSVVRRNKFDICEAEQWQLYSPQSFSIFCLSRRERVTIVTGQTSNDCYIQTSNIDRSRHRQN